MNAFDTTDLYYINNNFTGTRKSLFELAKWKNGLAFKNIDFSETGKPIIKIAELNNGISSSTAFSNKEYSREVHLIKGDLVFSWSGNPQTSIDIFRYNLPDGWLNQHIFKVTPFNEIVDKDFFFYIMKFLKPTFTAIATNKQTTGLGHVTITDLKRISLQIPPLPIQKKITGILKSLDDKIELNRQISKNLEEQAQAIFKDWFIDHPQSEWQIGKLSEIAEITMGQSPDGSSYNENKMGVVFYQGRAEFGFRFPTQRLFTTQPKRMAKRNDILLSVRAPVGDINVANENCCIGRGLAAIHSKDNHQSFLLYTMYSLKEELGIYNAQGTVFGCINRDALNDLEIVIPPKDVIDKFEKIVSSLDAKIAEKNTESTHLTQIRDTILPKLMSGEIKVIYNITKL